MSAAPVHRDSTTKTQSAVRRGAPTGQAGARKVTVASQAGVQNPGLDWVFVETWDEDVAFARPNVHISFDPDGTYTAP